MEKEIFTLKGSNSANWGFLMFATVGGLLAYWLDHTFLTFLAPVLYILAGSFVSFAIFTPLFWQKIKTTLSADKMVINRGLLFRKPQTISWHDLRRTQITYLENKNKITKNIDEIDLENTKDISIEAITFVLAKGNAPTFSSYEFDEIPFKEFLKEFQRVYHTYLGKPLMPPPSEKTIPKNQANNTENQADKAEQNDNHIDSAIQKCNIYLQEDQQLVKELKEAMNEAYSSIYQLHTLYIGREGDEMRLQKNDVVFSHQIDEENYHFYLKNNYKLHTEEAEIQTVEKLITTSLHNIGIVAARIKVYEEILTELEQTKAKYLQRLKVQAIANKIDNLQQRNIQKSDEVDELSFDTESIVQLELLTEKVKKADLELYAETLIQHANLIKDNQLDEIKSDNLLKYLDEKLK